ncbi:MAG: UvrD-helicase domain-containing protein [Oscillospiraceae bacterium]|nr:UvrD-helicase domain-containing protein [Oscillospiraceae bacterium]
MALITCPECGKRISDKAEACPYCGLPARYFYSAKDKNTDKNDNNQKEINVPESVDLHNIGNMLIGFEKDYSRLFNSEHYISSRDKQRLLELYGGYYRYLKDKLVFNYVCNHAQKLRVDIDTLKKFLTHMHYLDNESQIHNTDYLDRKLDQEKEYFDHILEKIDPNIILDEEQRKAVITDDDYCLLVAGAGAGKTTTMAAKAKYLVDKKGVMPEEIIVISYTNKAIGELKDRINKGLGINARICTFHSFAFDIVKKFTVQPPEINYSSYKIIFEMLEKAIFDNKDLMRKLVLFLGYYFDLTEDVFDFDNLNQYHLYKAEQDYETLKSSLGEYVQKVANQRSKQTKTINGEYLRSIQEVQIANFLYLNGLDYEYEHPYPFESPSRNKLYTPDFYISQGEHEAWLEHYAITENGYSNVLTPEEINKYKRSILNKRQLHKTHGTTLLETWSVYNDKLPLLNHLKETLEAEGFVLKPRDLTEVYKTIVDTGKDKYVYRLIQFMMDFIEHFKTTGYDAGGFDLLRKRTDNPRSLLFLDIAEQVYHYYQDQLKQKNQIDFADMINDANFYLQEIEKQKLELPYRYIIIDEFQDIARQRFNLTKKLSEITKAKVVAVGDDWQSIYAFSGSDITLFTKFLELMGTGTELKITHTYRNSQELIDIAGTFVQKNSTQIRKQLISPKHLNDPIILEEFDDSYKPFRALSEATEKAIGKIIEEFGIDSSILLLGRYNYDMYKLCQTDLFYETHGGQIKSKKYPDANLTYMTAHSSKGLGFDNVIIINMFEGKYGFPCQIEDDPIMKLVTVDDTSVPFAEERRLFYVSLTRTKNRVFVITPQKKPSRFLIELVKDFGLQHSDELNMEIVDLFNIRCPVCGYPLKFEYNKNYGISLWMCTNEPEVCDFMTNSKEYKHDIMKCPECEDGFLVVRTSKKSNAVFYGCTNFYTDRKCKYTKTLPSEPV